VGSYPITVGGTYFNPNYRIVYVDGVLTVEPENSLTTRNAQGTTSSASKETKDATGEKEVLSLKTSSLYPNPASALLQLYLAEAIRTVNDFRIFDATGKEQKVQCRKIGERVYEFSVSALSRGVYIIKAKTATGFRTFKFMKM
jgi:hypothetical protein